LALLHKFKHSAHKNAEFWFVAANVPLYVRAILHTDK